MREPRGYDAVAGCISATGGYPEFVVYDSMRVLIRYVIHYRVKAGGSGSGGGSVIGGSPSASQTMPSATTATAASSPAAHVATTARLDDLPPPYSASLVAPGVAGMLVVGNQSFPSFVTVG